MEQYGMMTREELQDQNDELRLELVRAREAAELVKLRQEVKGLKEEVTKLREELEGSERRRSQLQGELDTLNETGNNSRVLYQEKEERLLAGVKESSAEMAAAYKRWEESEAHLRSEVAARDATILELEGKLETKQGVLERQGKWMYEAQENLLAAEKQRSLLEQTIKERDTQIARHDREMREAVKQSRAFWAGVREALNGPMGCLVGPTCVVALFTMLVYVVSSIRSWLAP
jgi:chromosome segregation ATPase